MSRLIAILLGVCCAASAFAKGPPLIEAFGCKLRPGHTMADFNKAANAFAVQIEKVPASANYYAALLTPLRGYTPYDVVWIGSNPNLEDWAKSETASDASADVAATLAEIDASSTCESALYFETALYEGLKDEPGDHDAVIETYSCNLKPGKTEKDADAFDAALVGAMKALKQTSYSTYQWAPFFGQAKYQTVYLTVNDDLASFAAVAEPFNSSKEGQAANAAAATTFTCDSALWNGHELRVPATTPNH